jgi:hypothetical protein
MPDIIEKYGALWPAQEGEEIVFEEHDTASDLLRVIRKRNDGLFSATLYRKTIDPQWSLPWWSFTREAVTESIADAREYLSQPQEPWSYETFLAIYNRIAEERGGWHYDGNIPEAELEQRYRQGQYWSTVEEFAEGLFIWEQRVNI